MKIFYLDEDPYKAALWLDDVRQNKMILETAQLLCTAWNILEPDHGMPLYKSTHINHPCAVWVRESADNCEWLLDYWFYLAEIRNFSHKSFTDLWKYLVFGPPSSLNYKGLTLHPNCTTFKEEKDTVIAYRKYMCYEKWGHRTTWNYGEEPEWRKEYV